MERFIFNKTVLFSLFLTLTACQNVPVNNLNPDFGNAVITNAELQIINPEAGQTSIYGTMLYGEKGDRILKGYLDTQSKASKESLIKDIGQD